MMWLNESDLQWITVMFDARTMEIWIETVIGVIHRTVVLKIFQGRSCWPSDREWTVRVGIRERCSDAANQAIVTWSSLMAPSAHLRLTGETASWLRLGILPPVRGEHIQVQAVFQELTPLWTLVDWVDFQLDEAAAVPSRKVFRQTTMTRPPPPSQREIPREDL